MKLTDPELIQHLKDNYYIRRADWPKTQGMFFDGLRMIFEQPPFSYCQGFSFEDLQADWVLCPKE